MEVVGERPPPLPPKTKVSHLKTNSQDGNLKQSIIVRSEDGARKDGDRDEICLQQRGSSKKGFQFSGLIPRVKQSTLPSRKTSFSATLAKFANGSASSSKATGAKITTWAQRNSSDRDNTDSFVSINSFYKNGESNGGCEVDDDKDDDFLYQNVSNNGTNYIEYKLNGIINKSKAEKEKSKTQSSVGNRQIEVHQVKNKTVVKISIKDNFEESDGHPKRSVDDSSTVRLESVRSFKAAEQDDPVYANGSFGEDDQLYANLNASDPECDQTYENQDFAVVKKAKEKMAADKDEHTEQIYENHVFGSDDGTYENININITREVKSSAAVIDVANKADDDKQSTAGDVDTDSAFQKLKGRKVVVTISSLETKKEDSESGHKRAESLTSSGVGVDSEESDGEGSNISCDSLNSNELNALSTSEDHGYHTPNSENKTGSPVDYQSVSGDAGTCCDDSCDIYENFCVKQKKKAPPPPPPPRKATLPKGLLLDIQSRNVRLSATYPKGEKGGEDEAPSRKDDEHDKKAQKGEDKTLKVDERPYEERKKAVTRICAMEVDTDKFYKFHLCENRQDANGEKGSAAEEETFAGVKDYLNREKQAAIKSAKGTIRGVKNRVKAGIATFLQMHENKTYKDRDAGKIVVYSTTMGIVRETYHKCLKVKQILRTLMVKFEERDVFMSTEAQDEIRERMKCDAILVPQVFVEGQHIGDAETIERLNETGELRKILKPYKSADACSTCQVCGGYRLLPCSVCKGSKKSIHRNHFTAEFVALKCMNCDQVGLTKCHAC